MADIEIEKNLQEPTGEDNKVTRIKQLSEKVENTSKERDELAKLKGEEETKRIAAEKERDFYQGFATTLGKYPKASEHQEEIKSKVLSGYSMEDAAVAVLVGAGKFSLPQATIQPQQVLGGSGSTVLPNTGTKPVSEMSRDEKREALLEAQARGDFGLR